MWDFDAELENLDAVSDEFKGLYSQEGDKFVLAAKLSDKLAKGAGAHRALATERATVKTLKDQVTAFKAIGETPEAIQTRITEAEEKATQSPDRAAIEQTIQRRFEQKEASYQNQIKDLNERLTKTVSESDRDFLEREIADAISSNDGLPKALRPVLMQRVSVARDDNGERKLILLDDKGQEAINSRGEPLGSVTALAAMLKTSDDYAFAFKASGASGAGSAPNGGNKGVTGDNPFAEKTRNLTEAQNLIKTNPDRARTLAQAAGYPVNW